MYMSVPLIHAHPRLQQTGAFALAVIALVACASLAFAPQSTAAPKKGSGTYLSVPLALEGGVLVPVDRKAKLRGPNAQHERLPSLLAQLREALRQRGQVALYAFSYLEFTDAKILDDPNAVGEMLKAVAEVRELSGDWQKARGAWATWSAKRENEAFLTDRVMTSFGAEADRLGRRQSPTGVLPFLCRNYVLGALNEKANSSVGDRFRPERAFAGTEFYPPDFRFDSPVPDPRVGLTDDGMLVLRVLEPFSDVSKELVHGNLGVHPRVLIDKPFSEDTIERNIGDELVDGGYVLETPSRVLWWEAALKAKLPSDDEYAFEENSVQLVRRLPREVRRFRLAGPRPIETLTIILPSEDDGLARRLVYLLLDGRDYQTIRQNWKARHRLKRDGKTVRYIFDLSRRHRDALVTAQRAITLTELTERRASLSTLRASIAIGEVEDKLEAVVTVEAAQKATSADGKATVDGKGEKLGATAKPSAETHTLTLGFTSEKGKPFSTELTYEQKGFTKAADNITLGIGTNGAATGKIKYERDFVAFDALHRRLKLNLELASEFTPDRPFGDGRADERRQRFALGMKVDLLRDCGGHWLRGSLDYRFDYLSFSSNEVQLRSQSNSSVHPKLEYRYVDVGMSRRRLHPWRIGLDAGTRIVHQHESGRTFSITTVDASAHKILNRFFEFDLRGKFVAASGNTPLADRPSFGGQYSVRGYQTDASIALRTWAVQSEVWIPIRFLTFSETLDQVVRTRAKAAVFVDVGGAIGRATNGLAGTKASVGLGLRIKVSATTALRLDAAFPLTGDPRVAGPSVFMSFVTNANINL